MRPNIKKKIAIFLPVGFIDGENAKSIIAHEDIDYVIKEKPEGVFVSLSKVISFNKRGISILVEYLLMARESYGTTIGFCDFDKKKYNILQKMFANNLNFSIFDSFDIVTLFLGDNIKDMQDKKIIVFNEDSEQKNQLATELYERGLQPKIAKDIKDFLANRKNFDYVIENSFFVNSAKSHSIYIKDNVIIYTLKSFVDSSCSGLFDSVYHKNSLRVGFRVFLFDATKVSFVNVHGANFISKLSTAGAEHEVTFAICGLNKRNTTENLYHDLEDAGVMIYKDMKSFFEDEDILKEAKNPSNTSCSNRVITKKIVSILPIIVDSSINTIEVLSSNKAVKKSIAVQELSFDTQEKLISANIGIYGDINCIFIMIFNASIAKKTCNILLEEKSDDDDTLDALGELTHIIASKISQILKKQQIKINITMPRVFENIDDLVTFQKGNKGAQVNMEIDGKILTLFLAK